MLKWNSWLFSNFYHRILNMVNRKKVYRNIEIGDRPKIHIFVYVLPYCMCIRRSQNQTMPKSWANWLLFYNFMRRVVHILRHTKLGNFRLPSSALSNFLYEYSQKELLFYLKMHYYPLCQFKTWFTEVIWNVRNSLFE